MLCAHGTGTPTEQETSGEIETGYHRNIFQKTHFRKAHFGKSAAKRIEGGEKCEGVEKGVKTKEDKRMSTNMESDADNASKRLRSADNENQMEPSAEPFIIASGMENLAPEILITIFGLLPFDDLKRAILVCRFQHRFSLSDYGLIFMY